MTLETELLDLIERMKTRSRIVFEEGLSDREINSIEQRCNFHFPPDLKMFLQLALPIAGTDRNGVIFDKRFPDWRKNPVEIMQVSREWEAAFYFDIEHQHFWITEFGKKPETLAEQLAIAKSYFQTVPLLIPVCGHRMISAEPSEIGNPIFSVWRAIDTIHMGYNLQNYLRNEFIGPKHDWGQDSDYRPIRFWTKIVLYSNGFRDV